MRINHRHSLFSLMLIYAIAARAQSAKTADASNLQYSTDPDSGAVSMRCGDLPCWTYVPCSKDGKPYFHPLAIPGSGAVFTSHRPPDHAWHLGLWFSWKLINGANFWEPDTNGLTRVISQKLAREDNMAFTAETLLSYLAKGKAAVGEKRTVCVKTQRNGDYAIEWDSTFTAGDEAAVFSCTPAKKDKTGQWASGGYAGLMIRLADSPAFAYTLKNAQGQDNVEACGEPSEKVTIIVTEQATAAQARITFRDHPDNPRYPTPWFVRHNTGAYKGRGYYLIGPSMLFHEPYTLAPGQSARFRYTVTVERVLKV